MMMTTNPPAPPTPQSVARGDAQPPVAPVLRAPLTRMIGALVWKEARELAIWGFLAMGAMAAALAYTLYMDYRAGYTTDMIAISRGFRTVLMLLPPVMAAVLGFVQFFWEMRPGRYALLTHRPISRSLIFFCKAAVALGIYLVAMFVPVLLALYWLSNPANLPLPFEWSMAWSPVVDIVAAMPFFLAAALVAQRSETRWWGTRLLPLGAAVFSGIYNAYPSSLARAVVVTVLFAALLGVSARAYFRAAGQTRPQRRAARVAQLLVLFLGWSMVGLAGSLLLETIDREQRVNSGRLEWREAAFLTDGTPVILHEAWIDGNQTHDVEDTQGNKLFSLSYAQRSGYEPSRLLHMMSLMAQQNRAASPNPHEGTHYFIRIGPLADFEQWYLAGSKDYLVGYDTKQRRLVGVLGPDGLEPGRRVPARRFAEPINVMGPYGPKSPYGVQGEFMLLAVGDTLYRFTIAHDLTRVYTDPKHERIISNNVLSIGEGAIAEYVDPRYERMLDPNGLPTDRRAAAVMLPVVRTGSALTVLSGTEAAQPIVRFDLRNDTYSSPQIGYLPQQDAFLLETNQRLTPGKTTPTTWLLRRNGQVEPWPSARKPGPTPASQRRPFTPVEHVILAFTPPAWDAVAIAQIWDRYGADAAFDWRLLWRWQWQGRHWLPGAFVIVAAAVAAFFLGRKLHTSTRMGLLWAVVTLLGGIFGLLALLSVKPRTPMTTCAGCRQPRRVDQNQCPVCGASATGPDRTGAEVFSA
jgi:hypothetical protein